MPGSARQQQLLQPGYIAVSSESETSSDHAGRSSDEASDSDFSSASSAGPTGTRWRLLPQKRFVFKAILFRELLYLMVKEGFVQKKTGLVHASAFRRYAERLVSCLDPDLDVDYDTFGGDKQKIWLSWADIRRGIVHHAVPPVKLNTFERVTLVLEDPESCILAGVYSAISMIFIGASIGVVICKSVMHPEPRSVAFFDYSTICFFSCDYVARLVCSPYCRIAVFDREWHLKTTLHDELTGHKWALCCGFEATQMTKLHRLLAFAINPLNLVDLVSVAPYWLMFFFGVSHVPLAFLRAIRLIRFFRRVLKLGKFSVTLNILGRALANSVNMVYVILIYVLLITVLVGSVLQQVEVHHGNSTAPAFQSVPQASWWVTSRMVNGGHRSLMNVNEKKVGKPDTFVGSIVMTVVFVLKGVIWILPFAQIGATFKQYWKEHEVLMQLQRDVEIEDTRSAENSWIDSPFVALAPLEVWGSGSEHPALAGMGMIPVPIMEASAKSTVVTTCLAGGSMHHWFGSASVDVQVTWDPSEVRNGGTHGLLGIQPLQGDGFSGPAGVRWQCVVGAPLGVHGAQEDQWESGRSTGGGRRPRWRGPGATFDICLEARESATQDSKASKAVGMLEMQGHRISRLAKRTAGLEGRSATMMEQWSGVPKR